MQSPGRHNLDNDPGQRKATLRALSLDAVCAITEFDVNQGPSICIDVCASRRVSSRTGSLSC